MLLVVSMPIAFSQEYRLDYDRNGNLIYDEESNLYREYNEQNQLAKIRLNNATGTILQKFLWEPMEDRVFIKDEYNMDGSWKKTTYYFGSDYVITQNSSGIYNETYIFQEGILVGFEDTDGRKNYVLTDHLGSTSVVLDENGNVIENSWTSPFGELIEGGRASRYDFTRKEFDDLTQEYDFTARRMNPEWGRFTTPDTTLPMIYNPQGLNRYSYVYNNPYSLIDPDGKTPVTPWDVADYAFLALDYQAYSEDPSLKNKIYLGISVILTAAPIAPNFISYFRHGANAVKDGSRILRGAEDAASGAKDADNAKEAVKLTHKDWQKLSTTVKIGDNSLQFKNAQLEKKFKHAKDFGISSNWKQSQADDLTKRFMGRIVSHIRSKDTKEIIGKYHGQKGKLYYNSNTRLLAFFENGQFVTGHKLEGRQLETIKLGYVE